MKTSTTTTMLTCDVCGREASLPGITGWLVVARHPDAVDTSVLGDPDRSFDHWDVCSPHCIVTWGERRDLNYPQ